MVLDKLGKDIVFADALTRHSITILAATLDDDAMTDEDGAYCAEIGANLGYHNSHVIVTGSDHPSLLKELLLRGLY